MENREGKECFILPGSISDSFRVPVSRMWNSFFQTTFPFPEAPPLLARTKVTVSPMFRSSQHVCVFVSHWSHGQAGTRCSTCELQAKRYEMCSQMTKQEEKQNENKFVHFRKNYVPPEQLQCSTSKFIWQSVVIIINNRGFLYYYYFIITGRYF